MNTHEININIVEGLADVLVLAFEEFIEDTPTKSMHGSEIILAVDRALSIIKGGHELRKLAASLEA